MSQTPASSVEPGADPPVGPDAVALDADFGRLNDRLIEQLEGNAFAEAQATVAALRRLRPDDSSLIEAAAFIAERLAAGPVGEAFCLRGHRCWVNCVAFAPDGRLALSGSGGQQGPQGVEDGDDRSVRFWDVTTGKETHCLKGHSSLITGLAYSTRPVAQLVSASRNGTICLWDLEKRRATTTLQTKRPAVLSVAISDDGEFLVAGGEDHLVRLWQIASRKRIFKWEGHEDTVTGVVFLPGATRALSCGLDRTVRRWDAESGEQSACFEPHGAGILGIAVSGDGRLGATAGGDRKVCLWDSGSGKVVRRLLGHTGAVNCVALSRDGRRVLSGGGDRTVRLWDATTGEELHRFEGHTDQVKSVALSPAGGFALSGSADKTVRLWRLPE